MRFWFVLLPGALVLLLAACGGTSTIAPGRVDDNRTTEATGVRLAVTGLKRGGFT
ncbi:MAG: hypothetical protein NVS2B7_31480 [Herpetosiphon sp.]